MRMTQGIVHIVNLFMKYCMQKGMASSHSHRNLFMCCCASCLFYTNFTTCRGAGKSSLQSLFTRCSLSFEFIVSLLFYRIRTCTRLPDRDFKSVYIALCTVLPDHDF